MKISKDLADAVMMISCIILVLAGTSEFSDTMMKIFLIGGLTVLTLGMGAIRYKAGKKENQTN